MKNIIMVKIGYFVRDKGGCRILPTYLWLPTYPFINIWQCEGVVARGFTGNVTEVIHPFHSTQM
jgi:hypothetical protein